MVTDRLFIRSVYLDAARSTMDVAKCLAGLIELAGPRAAFLTESPIAVFAGTQHRGRGRRGRAWQTSSDVVGGEPDDARAAAECFEFLLKGSEQPLSGPSFADAAAGEVGSPRRDMPVVSVLLPRSLVRIPTEWVPLVTGCALYDAVDELGVLLASAMAGGPFLPPLCPKRIFLKWPNDLIACPPAVVAAAESSTENPAPDAGGVGAVGKLAGILVESLLPPQVAGNSAARGASGWLVVGLGVNLFRAPELGGPEVSGQHLGQDASEGMTSSHGRTTFRTLPSRPLAVAQALAGLFARSEGSDATQSRQCRREVERFVTDDRQRDMTLRRFAEALERELLEYLLVPRTVAQLRSLALARMIPTGWTLAVSEGGGQGVFEGLADDGALLLAGAPPVYAGDVSVRLVAEERPAAGGRVEAASKAAHPSRLGTAPQAAPSGAPRVLPGELFLDIGNTRLHWAYGLPERFAEASLGHIPHETLSSAAAAPGADEDVRSLLRALGGDRRSKVTATYFSVKDPAATKRVLGHLEACISRAYPEMRLECAALGIDTVRRHNQSLDVFLESYGPTMGIDRVLRLHFMTEQVRRSGGVVATVSLGTATTIEIWGQSQGERASGLATLLESRILPGVQMSFDALASGTALLPRLDYHAITPQQLDFADALQGTRASLARGVVLGLAETLEVLCSRHGVDKLWICGGSAAHFVGLGVLSGLPPGCRVEWSENLGLEALAALRALSRAEGRTEGSTGGRIDGVPRAKGGPETFRPLLGHALKPEPISAAVSTTTPLHEWGEASNKLAGSMFRGRRHYRSLAAAGLGTALTPDTADVLPQGDGVVSEPAALPLEDFRRLGPRIETAFVGERLDRHLGQRFRFHSRGDWQSRILRQEVLVEHGASRLRYESTPTTLIPVKATYRLRPFDQLWLFQPKEFEPDFVGEVEVLKDSGDAMAFHKPGNLVVHATGLYGRNTFLDVIAASGYQNVFPVHRIDRETSGLLLCARQSSTRRSLADLFREGAMRKMYLAVCKSFVDLPRWLVINAPIGSALGSPIRLKMWVGEHSGVQEAKTAFVTLSRVGDYALYACFPLTGRTNQIRVHLAAAGQWILGDKMYHPNENVFLNYFEHGLSEDVLRACEIPRQALHNAVISGPPESNDIFSSGPVVCPLSADLMELRIVRDLLEEGRLGLTPASQSEAFGRIFAEYDPEVERAAADVWRPGSDPKSRFVEWGLGALVGPTSVARERCASVIAPP